MPARERETGGGVEEEGSMYLDNGFLFTATGEWSCPSPGWACTPVFSFLIGNPFTDSDRISRRLWGP